MHYGSLGLTAAFRDWPDITSCHLDIASRVDRIASVCVFPVGGFSVPSQRSSTYCTGPGRLCTTNRKKEKNQPPIDPYVSVDRVKAPEKGPIDPPSSEKATPVEAIEVALCMQWFTHKQRQS
ncbi:hypothetical protein SUGI_1228600 [Cryptomeria japonica]|uniref:Uncharacterized protein n=1 Tax=Cryptomeria japonica TaxID=3369 RepID=A0AAD3NRP2_CRYJA|nr:hypothetical protein SUGI_1228600 [Cryptomeria japonica]